MADDRCDLLCLDLPRAEELRNRRLATATAESAAGRASALADPTRLMLAVALRDGGELCVCDLAWISERSQNLVSHHLRALRAVRESGGAFITVSDREILDAERELGSFGVFGEPAGVAGVAAGRAISPGRGRCAVGA